MIQCVGFFVFFFFPQKSQTLKSEKEWGDGKVILPAGKHYH